METEEGQGKGANRGGPRRAAALRKAARAAGAVEKKRLARAGRAARGAVAAEAGPGAATAKRGAKARGANARAGREGRRGMAKVGGLRRRRMFDSGELRLVLLKMIADEPRHGYELIKAIEELTSGGYAPSPGVVYPTLTMLGESGHVTGEEDGDGRRRFSITGAGSAELVESEDQVSKLFARLSTAGEKHKQTDAVPVRRAMSNLRAALQDRLSRGDISDETLLQVVALIDEAAQKIERLG
ncbi:MULTISPECIES: PadR family transcriptional regulator [unclassified Sphingomonas]|uniref:PadR family transcriptional regulator n=1 Tax=unclassified Sphingomonas TaxID=196159 RepID=UPI001D100A2A|nr:MULTISPECIES: PadR family transcriptional regulator [unclassified Sphingomonas]MCC2979038.1 PadR family transcriptional regulator [Sphingomonas sp. IC4-52]MCD2315716.1 PadR family transcriptional regulator [Sphingomonas sp. IC-11]